MNMPLALIIEDDPQLGQIFSISLQGTFETELLPDGSEALSRIAQVVPSVIVLDLHLPSYSGREILSKIHADKRLVHTKIIVSTADARQAEMLRDEVDIVLVKPVSPVQLRDLASRLLSTEKIQE